MRKLRVSSYNDFDSPGVLVTHFLFQTIHTLQNQNSTSDVCNVQHSFIQQILVVGLMLSYVLGYKRKYPIINKTIRG